MRDYHNRGSAIAIWLPCQTRLRMSLDPLVSHVHRCFLAGTERRWQVTIQKIARVGARARPVVLRQRVLRAQRKADNKTTSLSWPGAQCRDRPAMEFHQRLD